MNLTPENKREKEFHNKLQSGSGRRFENIFYRAISNMFKDFYDYLRKNCENKEILDYGCGIGHNVNIISKFNPSKIVGMDISEISIEKAKNNSGNDNIKFVSDNCENSSFDSNSFDLIYGSGILHHLKLEKALEEINRLLKQNGKIVFMEPLGTNPFINLYRNLTPKARSPDEHPLKDKDFEHIKKYFKNLQLKFYGFFTLIFFIFYKNPDDSKFFRILSDIDQTLFKYNFFRKFAWSILIIAQKN